MTTIRIAHAEPRPGKLANGGFHTRGYLVVLADDAGHRAVPIWMQEAGDLASLLERQRSAWRGSSWPARPEPGITADLGLALALAAAAGAPVRLADAVLDLSLIHI